MTWTRLEDTLLWSRAKTEYGRDPRRKYHNWTHVQRLYFHAEHTLALPYDPQLDKAVLCHDVIYDEKPDKELRSAEWMMKNDPSPSRAAYDHIIKTAGHALGSDNRILMLDLADFAIPECVATNRNLIEEESILLYGIGSAEFARANLRFLEAMAPNYSKEKLRDLPEDERAFFTRVRSGILQSAAISRRRMRREEKTGKTAISSFAPR